MSLTKSVKNSELADSTLRLLEQGKIFEAKMEIITLRSLLRMDESFAKTEHDMRLQLDRITEANK